jgi:O-antigen/teichoic acid export membrane protein
LKPLWAALRPANAGDTSTAEARSRERYRRIILTTLTSASAKGINLLTLIVSVPLTIHYLGTERYALWMVISSSVTMLAFTDLGIGNGLLNAISESHGKGDERSSLSYVSSAFFMLSGIAAIALTILAACYHVVPWAKIFNVTSPLAVSESGPSSAVFVACFAIGLPLGVVTRTQLGYQDGFTNNLWTVLGSLLGLVGLLLAVHLRAGLPWLVLSITGTPLLATALNGLVLFGFQRRSLAPRWSEVNRSHMKQLLRFGVYFFILQSCVTSATNVDYLITAHLLGPAAVTTYSVTMRLFTIVPGVLMMVLWPLWPAYGESIARGEICWARRALFRSLKLIVAVTCVVGTALCLFGPWILRHWVGKSVATTRALLLGAALWMVLSTAANAVSIFLNGAKKMNLQIYSALGMCLSSVLLKLLLVPLFGVAAIMWSTNLAYAVMVWVPIVMFLPKLLIRMQSEADARRAESELPANFAEEAVGAL